LRLREEANRILSRGSRSQTPSKNERSKNKGVRESVRKRHSVFKPLIEGTIGSKQPARKSSAAMLISEKPLSSQV
jgi:hypothetical protein